jgi:hypothetical protein
MRMKPEQLPVNGIPTIQEQPFAENAAPDNEAHT